MYHTALEGWTESLASELDPAWNIKVTLIEPGAFKTSVFEQDRMVVVPAPPVYDTPSLPGWHLRGAVLKNAGQAYDTTAELKQADPAKAVAKIIELGRLENPPLRFAVGKDSIVSIRGKLKKVEEELDAYESWSENLA
ncbi:hypothetical protein C8Q78DRAFT_993729 [Trametes maxima]|nr:hypothetical protein C8Q78DRAFT_993729 [Trametes maxima]